MTTDRRLYDMDLGRRDHTRWLGSNRYAGGGPPPPPEPFGIITQAGVQITTQDGDPLITQDGP
jgi:hypothetical protein